MPTMLLGSRFRQASVAAALTAALLLGACGSSDTVVGFMHEVTSDTVTLKMPDGSNRTFLVEAEDAAALDLPHLQSHVGITDVGFRATYETVDGKDYLQTAEEVAPPR